MIQQPMPFLTMTNRVFQQAVDMILPPRCVVTGEEVQEQGMMAPEAWGRLRFISDPYCGRCGMPFDFEIEEGAVCVDCMETPPPYDAARAALVYDDESRAVILKFKHADHLHNVHSFMPWLERAGGVLITQADYFVPVPLHRHRLLSRRYNQSALLAQLLARRADRSCLAGALLRKRATPSQGYMNYKDRRKNVRNAFAIHPKYEATIKNKSILLIDDVYTTGSTVKECAETLLRAGASTVNVLCIARTVRDR